MAASKYLDVNGLSYFYSILSGNIDVRLPFVSKTTAEWSTEINTVSAKDTLYIYSDYRTITRNGKTVTVPGLKVGDGQAYIVDLPFVAFDDETFLAHVNNGNIHTTAAEKEFWNNKVRCYTQVNVPETLIFTTN